MQAVILCGGPAKAATGEDGVPLPLLDIGGRSVLQIQGGLLRGAGVEEILIVPGASYERLFQAVGEEVEGLPLRYVCEEKPLGTGGAIQHVLPHITSWPLFVLNGDVLLEADLSQMLSQFHSAMDALLLGVEVPDARSYGRLIYQEDSFLVEDFVEKDPDYYGAGFINGGVYLFAESIQECFPARDVFSIEYDVFPRMERIYVHLYSGMWVDIGSPELLEFARRHLSRAAEPSPAERE